MSPAITHKQWTAIGITGLTLIINGIVPLPAASREGDLYCYIEGDNGQLIDLGHLCNRPTEVVSPSTVLNGNGPSSESAIQGEDCDQLVSFMRLSQNISSPFEAELQTFSQAAAAATTLEEVTESADFYVAIVGDFILEMSDFNRELLGLPLKDAELVRLRDSYAQTLQGLSEGLGTVARAMQGVAEVSSEAKLPGALEQLKAKTAEADASLQALDRQENAIIGGINQYCGASLFD